MKPESTKTKAKRIAVSSEWFRLNPPEHDGYWYCYLGISPYCLRRMTNPEVCLEHVYPKNKYPALRYEVLNLKASCSFCNELKLSNTIAALQRSGMFPMLTSLIRSPDWQEWEAKMAELAEQLGVRLDQPLV